MAVLGFNIGTRGTPVLVDDEAGSVLAATADHQPFAVPQSGRAEQDPHDRCQQRCRTFDMLVIPDSQRVRSSEQQGVLFPDVPKLTSGAQDPDKVN